ncbi:MAG TPA: hypothetical protein VFU21_30380 [Kofleriaceae bacterium]|nr:hypothetical protein [Kofleriaceae bacterium]
MPDPDGGPGVPDGAPLHDAPPPVEPVLLETLTIDVSVQSPISSAVVLAAGHTYQLIASGEAIVRDDDLGRFEGDADYWYNGTFFGDRAGDVDMGLAVNDFDGDDSRAPNWGDFNDSHVYQATVAGNDAVLTAQFFDPDFGNGNSGSLTLEIWGPPP